MQMDEIDMLMPRTRYMEITSGHAVCFTVP